MSLKHRLLILLFPEIKHLQWQLSMSQLTQESAHQKLDAAEIKLLELEHQNRALTHSLNTAYADAAQQKRKADYAERSLDNERRFSKQLRTDLQAARKKTARR